MNSTNILEKTSSISFLLGLITSRVQLFLPAPLLPIADILSLTCYLIGYSSWFALNYRETSKKSADWSTFLGFKEQHKTAAMIGIVATIFSFCAITMPILVIPSGWLFVCSNVFWSAGEYNKHKNRPQDSKFSASYQENYMKFAVTMTAMGLISAIAVTLTFLCPALSVSIVAVTAFANIGLGFMAFEYWLKSAFENKNPPACEPPPPGSYAIISSALPPKATPNSAHTPDANQKNHSTPLKANTPQDPCLTPNQNHAPKTL